MESKYGKQIITELKMKPVSPEKAANYATFAKRILWIDEDVVEGSFQMNSSWYLHPSGASNTPGPHWHDCDEIIGFIGNDPENPSDLGGEIEFWLEDEQHIITKSCYIFVPKGMKHCPLIVRRVDRPIYHFSTVTARQYEVIKDKQ
jgi:hypothetical protein